MHSRLSKHIKHRNICYFGWVLQISQDRKITWNYIQACATQCQAFSLLGFRSFWSLREIQQRKVICLKIWFLLLCSLSETRIDNGEKLNLTAASSHKRFHKSVPSLIDIVPTIEQRLLQPSHSIFSNLFDQHANLWFLFDASGKNCMKQIILGSNFVFIFDFF